MIRVLLLQPSQCLALHVLLRKCVVHLVLHAVGIPHGVRAREVQSEDEESHGERSRSHYVCPPSRGADDRPGSHASETSVPAVRLRAERLGQTLGRGKGSRSEREQHCRPQDDPTDGSELRPGRVPKCLSGHGNGIGIPSSLGSAKEGSGTGSNQLRTE